MNIKITQNEETGNIILDMDMEAAGELYYALVVAKVNSDSELKTFKDCPDILNGVKEQNDKFRALMKLLRPELG